MKTLNPNQPYKQHSQYIIMAGGHQQGMFAEYKAAMNIEMKDMQNWLAEKEWEMLQVPDEQMNKHRRVLRKGWTWATRWKSKC